MGVIVQDSSSERVKPVSGPERAAFIAQGEQVLAREPLAAQGDGGAQGVVAVPRPAAREWARYGPPACRDG
jgi:hypothetical protein